MIRKSILQLLRSRTISSSRRLFQDHICSLINLACFRNSSNLNYKAMSSVYVKSFTLTDDVSVRNCASQSVSSTDDSENRILISIELLREGRMKTFNLNRLNTEIISVTFKWLGLKLAKKLLKKPKKKKAKTQDESLPQDMEEEEDQEEQKIPLELLHNGNPVDLSMLNQDAWIEGAVLKVNNEEIPLTVNAPSVLLDKLPAMLMAGFPIHASPEFEFVDKDKCDFRWKTVQKNDFKKTEVAIKKGQVLDVTDTVSSKSFTPTDDDIGCYVLLACIPKRGDKVGRLEAVISKSVITSGPNSCPFEKRHEFTQSSAEHGTFRVLCYNLLAEMYADSVAARTELFVHCPLHALQMDYRKHLLLKEMLGYKADILCLQEVDKSIFKNHLTPALSFHGYTGLFRPKAGHVGEGCATFIRDTKFMVIKKLNITLSKYLMTHPDCADIWAAVSQKEPLKFKVEGRSNILQVTILDSLDRPGQLLCVANTHLYFHPTADNIRLIHMATALRYLQSVVQAYEQQGSSISMVLCGDFNSDPPSGAYQLAAAQFVPSDFVSWDSAGPEEKVEGLTLQQSMNIESACGTPEYTSYTPHFVATLDYIFIDSDKLQVKSTVPLPDHCDVIADGGLPSAVFPSDHLALVCDLKVKD